MSENPFEPPNTVSLPPHVASKAVARKSARVAFSYTHAHIYGGCALQLLGVRRRVHYGQSPAVIDCAGLSRRQFVGNASGRLTGLVLGISAG